MAKPPVLTPRADDFPRWYQDVLQKAQLAENGPVRGTMVIRPYGYSLWERMQAEVDQRIKACGAENAYFPLFIPQSYLEREAEHVEGFSPELAVVTHAGGKELEEPLVVRPTSETIINHFFAKWISSHRDLPLKVNNWSNIVRWELRPRLFLRTTEFLWQEGHTAHASAEEAHEFALHILDEVYAGVMRDELAVPVYTGLKTDREKFAGADRTWTCEGIMRDGKALQMGTSHELGQNFSRAFGTRYTDRDGELREPFQTSWGATTRLLGAMIMVHGDDRGLRLPPRVAPTQVVVLVVKDDGMVIPEAHRIASALEARGVRVRVDDQVDVSFGRRVTDWELKGAPLRVELGPRDVAAAQASVISRTRGEKQTISAGGVARWAVEALEADQAALLEEATRLRDDRTAAVDDVAGALEHGGAVRIPWAAVGDEGEQRLAAAGLSVRCLLRDGDDAIVARAY
jgi:prolyl-tRNA synthetase